ncbi:MAG: TonB family protein [Gemmatimonadetes bacterium]|nr:TonB family protein [Gemmatimonadota bacterium]
MHRIQLALALATTVTVQAAAQKPAARLIGAVHTVKGAPIADADVIVAGTPLLRTDSTGRFVAEHLSEGHVAVLVRKLGFEMRRLNVEVSATQRDTLEIVLEGSDVAIADPEVDALHDRLADFNRRRSRATGWYFTRAEIERRHPTNLSDLLRTLPGVRVALGNDGKARLRMGRSITSSANRVDCPVEYVVDGVRPALFNIDDMNPMDVEGIEIYNGAAALPPELTSHNGNSSCGVIVIWTRLPGG